MINLGLFQYYLEIKEAIQAMEYSQTTKNKIKHERANTH